MIYRDRKFLFIGPDGKEVEALVRYDYVVTPFPGSQEEPPDVAFRTSLHINGVPVSAVRHRAIVDYVEEHGGRA